MTTLSSPLEPLIFPVGNRRDRSGNASGSGRDDQHCFFIIHAKEGRRQPSFKQQNFDIPQEAIA